MEYLENAIIDYLNNNPDKKLNSLDVIDHFKLRVDVTFSALKRLEDTGKVIRVDGYLGGWNGNHYYKTI